MKQKYDINKVGEFLDTIEKPLSRRIILLIFSISLTIGFILISYLSLFVMTSYESSPIENESLYEENKNPCIIESVIVIIILIVLFYISFLMFSQPYYFLLFEKGLVINIRTQSKFFSAPKSYRPLLTSYPNKFKDYFIPLNKIKESYIVNHPILRYDGSIVIKEIDGKWHWVHIPVMGPNHVMEKLSNIYGDKWNRIYKNKALIGGKKLAF